MSPRARENMVTGTWLLEIAVEYIWHGLWGEFQSPNQYANHLPLTLFPEAPCHILPSNDNHRILILG